ncbi:MAG: serine/threonine protein kinase [Acetobacteraceae bacterium]|nr:serine/threonine protein kinase [Acetobacteraceae bacterium]
MLLKEGELVRDTYEVERFLGEGAFAEVYRVKHRFLGRQAMKVFKCPGSSEAEAREMLSEAVLLSSMGHPNIIRVFDAGVIPTGVGECAFFTMEYVAGGNLETFWRSHGPRLVPVGDAVDIVRQVCRGLALAHAEQPPIIHRDVKPQNILIGYDALGLRVRVSDFGLAKRVNPLTLIASARGTRAFKPPEFLRNVDSCAGDVWAVGSVLYLLLTDRLPFPAAGEVQELDASVWERPLVPASRFNARVDPGLEAILARALALDLGDRYPDAGKLLEDLMRWKGPEGGAAGRDFGPEGGRPAAKEHPGGSKPSAGSAPLPGKAAVEAMVRQALEMGRDARRLTEAADLLEEALNLQPGLRDRYEYYLRLWRRGIVS